MNWTAQYRKDGPASFFRTTDRPKPRVMTRIKARNAQLSLRLGFILPEVARRANLKESTLRKALQRQGVPRLPEGMDDDSKTDRQYQNRTPAALTQRRPAAWVLPARAQTNGYCRHGAGRMRDGPF